MGRSALREVQATSALALRAIRFQAPSPRNGLHDAPRLGVYIPRGMDHGLDDLALEV